MFPLVQSFDDSELTPLQPTLGIAHGVLRLLDHGNPFHKAPDEQFLY